MRSVWAAVLIAANVGSLAATGVAAAQGLPPGAYADPRGPYIFPNYPGPRYPRSAYPAPGADFSYPDGAPVPAYPGSETQLGVAAQESTREVVADTTGQPAGTIIVDTGSRHLYYTTGHGQALAYGIGVGREGFLWKGSARVGRKAQWPGWTPPASMLKRRPDLPRHMEGGLDNPLGARALYLYQGDRDTLFRIHGTNEPDTIGQAVSSGCIRMMNADVIDLFQRAPVGTRVVVI